MKATAVTAASVTPNGAWQRILSRWKGRERVLYTDLPLGPKNPGLIWGAEERWSLPLSHSPTTKPSPWSKNQSEGLLW